MNQTRAHDSRNLMVGLMIALALIVITLVVAIFLATRRPVVVILPAEMPGDRATVGVLGPRDGEQALSKPESAKPLPEQVAMVRLAKLPTYENPLDPIWESVAPQLITLAPQQVAEPVLKQGTVSQLEVKAVHEANRYLWRLSWAQAEPAVESNFAKFSDAVAIQFPLVDGAPYTMGGPNQPVAIFYWRALWQKDVDEGFQDTVVTRPNAQTDFYWFAGKTGTISAAELATNGDPMALQWMIAAKAGNPMADLGRQCPLEELKSHGFGSSTHIQSASGPGNARGIWQQGRWYVVFEREFKEDDVLLKRFQDRPQEQLMAFAVWDGQAQNRGGQKNISNWIPMRIEK